MLGRVVGHLCPAAVVGGGGGGAGSGGGGSGSSSSSSSSSSTTGGRLWLPRIFGNGMVLQACKPIKIWGTAAPHAEVTVTFGPGSAESAAGADGHWAVVLPPQQPSSATGQSLRVEAAQGGGCQSFEGCLIGEVWLASGQSNMQMALSSTEHYEEARLTANSRPLLRLFQIETVVSATPQVDTPASSHWHAATSETVGQFSAVGFHFAEKIQEALGQGTPVGIINSSWGGTEIEPWTPLSGFDAVESLSEYSQRVQDMKEGDEVDAQTPGAIYNAMIHPLQPLSLRGLLWYGPCSHLLIAILLDTLHGSMNEQTNKMHTCLPACTYVM